MRNGAPSKRPKWAVGVVTAPRPHGVSYLPACLQSLQSAGWTDIVIFAEPDAPIPHNFTGDVVCRRKQFGDWTNWATGLYELLFSEPDADYFLMLEDDTVVCRASRLYLESTVPLLNEFASVSIYTPAIYHRKRIWGYHNCCRGWLTWTTNTVLMTKDKVMTFFSDTDTLRHRFENIFDPNFKNWGCTGDPKNSVKDAVLGKWAYKNRLPMYFHTPSLAEHLGVASTVMKDTVDMRGRQSRDFVGEEADLEFLRTPEIRRFTKIPLL